MLFQEEIIIPAAKAEFAAALGTRCCPFPGEPQPCTAVLGPG